MLQESWISLWHKIGKLLCWSDLQWQMEELMDKSLQTWLSSSVKWKRNTLDVISEGEGAQLATSCKGKPQGSCEMFQSWFRIWQCHKDIRWSTIAETNVSAPETLGSNLRDQLGPQWPIRAPLRGCRLGMLGVPFILVMTLLLALTESLFCVATSIYCR